MGFSGTGSRRARFDGMADPSARNLSAGIAGLAGVALNVVAVAALRPVPHAYRPGDLDAWLAEARAVPGRVEISGWAFTLGLAGLATWAVGLAQTMPAESRSGARSGASLVAFGALLDAAGTLLPVAALSTDDATGKALLQASLLLDASFNGLLGAGLLTLGLSAGAKSSWPRRLRTLAVAAGVASLPVALQARSDTAARLLLLAGPLWLSFVTWTSIRMLRGREG